MSRSSEEGTQQTLTSVVAVAPPASLPQEALGKRQNLKIPPAHQENTSPPQPTPIAPAVSFPEMPFPLHCLAKFYCFLNAWPSHASSGSPVPLRQAGRALAILCSRDPRPLHPILCGHLRHCLGPDCEAKLDSQTLGQ